MLDPALEQACEALKRGDLPGVYRSVSDLWQAGSPEECYRLLLRRCLAAERYDLAESLAQSILERHFMPEAAHALGRILASRGDLEGARHWLRQAAESRTDDPDLLSDLGVVLWGLGLRGAAISNLERAIALAPDHEDAPGNLASIKSSREHRLRILFLGDSGSPHTRRFVSYFAAAGHYVYLLSGQLADIPGVEVLSPLEPIPPLQLAGWMSACHDAIRQIKPDIVHGHYASIQGLWGALSGFHPYVLTLWGSDINVDPHLSQNYFSLVRFALEQADLITGDSSDLLVAAEELASGPLAPRKLIRFGVDTDRFRPGLDSTDLRARFDIGAVPVVFSPRQFKRPANIHRIIEAAPTILERLPTTVFVLKTFMTGQDEYSLQLHELAERLGVSGAIRWVLEGPHEEMPLWYNLADVTLSIRDFDAGSVSVMEAMACGTPVIASDIPSNRELLGDTGLLVDPQDSRGLANRILQVLESPAASADLARSARQRIKTLADYRANMDQMEDLYSQLLSGLIPAQSDLAELQREAVARDRAGASLDAYRHLDAAWDRDQTAWDRVRISLTADLLSHPKLYTDQDAKVSAIQTIMNA